MRKLIGLAVVALTAACAAERPLEVRQDEEARLAAALKDYRQSGPAVSCVSMRELQGNRSIGEGVIIFESLGRTLYVNRPRAGCPELGMSRALRTRTTETRLCSGDLASVFDTTTGTDYGGCALGDFTPYERVN